jgi:hypothetical protein
MSLVEFAVMDGWMDGWQEGWDWEDWQMVRIH